MSVFCLSHAVCGILLCQPKQMNTPSLCPLYRGANWGLGGAVTTQRHTSPNWLHSYHDYKWLVVTSHPGAPWATEDGEMPASAREEARMRTNYGRKAWGEVRGSVENSHPASCPSKTWGSARGARGAGGASACPRGGGRGGFLPGVGSHPSVPGGSDNRLGVRRSLRRLRGGRGRGRGQDARAKARARTSGKCGFIRRVLRPCEDDKSKVPYCSSVFRERRTNG